MQVTQVHSWQVQNNKKQQKNTEFFFDDGCKLPSFKDHLKQISLEGLNVQHTRILNTNLSPQTPFLHSEGSYCCEHYFGRSNALLKAPLSSSEEIHSSCGCMCQISLVLALATAESSPSDVCALESVTIILFSYVQDIKQCPLSTEKQIEGTGLTASTFVLDTVCEAGRLGH